jgi:tetratricopeptide (TPR) repeat protein
MRYVWFGLLVLVVCTPLVLVSLLFAEAMLPSLDAVTLHEPLGVRKTIAQIAANDAGYGKDAPVKLARVLRLDPENPEVWSRRCTDSTYPGEGKPPKDDALAVCQHAAALDSSSYNWSNVGKAQEAAGKYCDAQQSYSRASEGLQQSDASNFRALGRSALLCGQSGIAIAELNLAQNTDGAGAANPNVDDDERELHKEGLQTDREWLTFAYANTKQPEQASKFCGLAHPDWQNCSCEVVKGEIKCSGVAFKPKQAKRAPRSD